MKITPKVASALLAAVVAAAVVAGCAGKPAEHTAPAATQETKAPAAAPAASSPAAAAPAATSAAGGKFAVVADQSLASYAVAETFLGQKRDAVAIGKTSAFTGELVLEGGVIKPSVIQVDLSTLKSDESRRDNRVRDALDTANHKFAVFTVTGAEGGPVTEGQEVALKLKGNMKIKGTEKPLVLDAKAKLVDGTLTLAATTTFKMTTFGVNPPNIANFVAVVDEVKMDVTFVGKKQ